MTTEGCPNSSEDLFSTDLKTVEEDCLVLPTDLMVHYVSPSRDPMLLVLVERHAMHILMANILNSYDTH